MMICIWMDCSANLMCSLLKPRCSPSRVATSTYGARPKTKKQKKFNKEDGLIVLVWLNTSKDPVNRTNQTCENFWKRFAKYYNTNKDFVSDHIENSFMHRWLIIIVVVNKFCSCYNEILCRNQSGPTIQDKIML